jgi:hypothetical protein
MTTDFAIIGFHLESIISGAYSNPFEIICIFTHDLIMDDGYNMDVVFCIWLTCGQKYTMATMPERSR